MADRNKQNLEKNKKEFVRIVLSRKTLGVAICIVLAIALTAFVLKETIKEKYLMTPTVSITFVTGEYKKLEPADKYHGSGIDTDYGWYLPYTGEA